jgi:diguanylate cyclase (GGDEF)-like protein
MPPAPIGPNEPERLRALGKLEILDTPPSEVFDCFVRIARQLFDTPIAAISLVDADRQWFKAIEGGSRRETPRDWAFCGYTILNPDQVLCVPDAAIDERFADNPLVTGPTGFRFYAGAPLVDVNGHALGALCVIDKRPRAPDEAALRQLRDLATCVTAALRLHGALHRLADEALRDPLTGLPNRRVFDATLQALGPGAAATLFMLDLDHFKAVNDAFGHQGADAALREVARRLRRIKRRPNKAFRLGGDFFGLLVTGMQDEAAAAELAAEIHGAMADPFLLDGQAVPLRASIGVATMPTHARTASQMLHAADAALYAAKRAGRGITWQAQPCGKRRRAAGRVGMGRIVMREALRDALLTPRFEQFQLHFQPVADLLRGRVAAHEALVRWTLPHGLQIGPADFVPLAEESGLVSHLDRWVLQQACATAAAWRQPWRVAVNISPVTIALLDVVAVVRDTLQRTGLAPDRLVIEVTETAPVSHPDRMIAAISGLHRLGVRPIVDDFGAGHASLAYLRRYPFDRVKTDRCFVEGLGTDARAAPVMEALVRLARSLDILLVAEGVETETQFAILRRLGVSRVQGYLLARPVPPEQIAETVIRAERKLARLLKRHAPPARAAGRPAEPAGTAEPGWLRDSAYEEPLVA